MTEKNLLTDEMSEYLDRTRRQVDDYLARMKADMQDNTERMRWHRPLGYNQFMSMITAAAENIMRRRGTYAAYVVDGVNRDFVIQLYYYFIGDQAKCKMNVDKGIFLYGSIGSGKTLIMSALLEVIHAMCNISTRTIHAKQIYETIGKNGIETLVPCPLFIDELGRESLEINEFGNKIRPLQDLIAMRYEAGGRTFATSNFSTEQLEGKNVDGVQRGYGKYVRSRMEEMMNVVKMPGDNRRPKY